MQLECKNKGCYNTFMAGLHQSGMRDTVRTARDILTEQLKRWGVEE